jgi:hypothetical protein
VAALALSNACGDSEAPSAPPASDVIAFCNQFGTKLCDEVERCGCGGDAAGKCRAFIPRWCADESWTRLNDAVKQGRIVYHPEAGAALLAGAGGGAAACARPFDFMKIRFGTLHTLAGTFVGTIDTGRPCVPLGSYKGGWTECKAGLCEAGADPAAGICKAFAAPDERCTTGPGALEICVDPNRGSDQDNEFESSVETYRCVTAFGSPDGTCRSDLPDGSDCDSNRQCASYRCISSKCTAKLVIDQACASGVECASGQCTNMLCAHPLPDGAACGPGDTCQGGVCVGPYTAGVCGSTVNLAVGQPCADSDQCASLVCSGERCVAAICREYVTRVF